MALSWYAMRSKPNKEEFLAGQLRGYGVEVYFPALRVKPVNPRAKKIRPYFPNYLFVRVDLDEVNMSDLQWMPGASGLVSFAGEPASVPDFLIAALRRQVDLHNEAFQEQRKNFKPGEPIVIQEGPFAGYEAIFDTRISGQDRVRVLLKLLQSRQVPVELSDHQIRRAKRE
jgi:transcriptional antiterminator RfaH